MLLNIDQLTSFTFTTCPFSVTSISPVPFDCWVKICWKCHWLFTFCQKCHQHETFLHLVTKNNNQNKHCHSQFAFCQSGLRRQIWGCKDPSWRPPHSDKSHKLSSVIFLPWNAWLKCNLTQYGSIQIKASRAFPLLQIVQANPCTKHQVSTCSSTKQILICSGMKHQAKSINLFKHQVSSKSLHVQAPQTSGWASPSPWSGTASPRSSPAARSAGSWITRSPDSVILFYGTWNRVAVANISWLEVVLLNGWLAAWEQSPSSSYLTEYPLSILRHVTCHFLQRWKF